VNCTVTGNRVIIQQSELDIYDAQALKERISSVAADNDNTVEIDLREVGAISTPIVQILLAAKKGLKYFRVFNLKEEVYRTFHIFGLDYEDI